MYNLWRKHTADSKQTIQSQHKTLASARKELYEALKQLQGAHTIKQIGKDWYNASGKNYGIAFHIEKE